MLQLILAHVYLLEHELALLVVADSVHYLTPIQLFVGPIVVVVVVGHDEDYDVVGQVDVDSVFIHKKKFDIKSKS